MKVFYTALIAVLVALGFAFGIIFETAAPLIEKESYLWQRMNNFRKEKKEIVSVNENFVLPPGKYREPVRKSGKEDINIAAKSVLAIDEESGKILYEKEPDKKMAIASLTKLATALTLLEFASGSINGKNYNLSRDVTISKTAVEAEGDSGFLVTGEKIKASDLLVIMLVASSNDAAWALAEDAAKSQGYSGGVDDFVQVMNDVAKASGLINTHFSNPTGIDAENHYSTARDVIKMAEVFLRNYPDFFRATKFKELDIKSSDGKNNHHIKSTNALLGQMTEVEGGKTGYTDEAGESLLLVVKNPASDAEIIAVVIGSDDRFGEMKKLMHWIFDAYEWRNY